jgi:hypothetical protein
MSATTIGNLLARVRTGMDTPPYKAKEFRLDATHKCLNAK